MPQYSDDLLLGPVVAGGPNSTSGLLAANRAGGSSPMTRGIGPLGRVFIYDQVPLTLAVANIAALQTTAGAAALALTAATGVTTLVDSTGTTRYVLDIPRAVSLTSTGNISAVNFTVKGYDAYGQPMTATLAGPNNNTVNTLKAFMSVISITASAAVGTNTSAGTSDIFGLPVYVPDAGYIVKAGWAGALAQNAGTLAIADATSPATAATGDVRGTFAQATSASNGTRRLVLTIALAGTICGPEATRLGALGVTQF